jgi:hypothetical protein
MTAIHTERGFVFGGNPEFGSMAPGVTINI